MIEELKNCTTCGHKNGSLCLLSGYAWTDERQYPTTCGRNFQGWVSKKYGIEPKEPKEPLLVRIKHSLGIKDKPVSDLAVNILEDDNNQN